MQFEFVTSRLMLLLLLLCFAGRAHAELIMPNGDDERNEKGATFTMESQFRLFGQDIAAGTNNFLTRATGRIVIGAGSSSEYDTYNSNEAPKFNLIQPLEFVRVTNTKSLIVVVTLRHLKVTGAQLANLSSVITQNFWGMQEFSATAGYLFTWEQQVDAISPSGTNTFQAALLCDATRTFAIYNYQTLNFTKSPIKESGLMSGFARANSYETVTLPFRGDELPKLATLSGVSDQRAGMFVYRIDSWPPIRGGCVSQDPTSPGDRTLSSTVVRDSVLGGSVAVVSGACHSGEAGDRGTCRVTIDGREVGQTPARMCPNCGRVFLTCQLPAALREGRAQLSMTLTGSTAAYSREIQFASPDESLGPRISLTEPDEWHKLSPQALRMTFNPSLLNGTIKLQIIGYSEHGLSELESAESRAKLIKVLHTMNISSSSGGQLDLRSPAINCQLKEDCEMYHLGYLQIVDESQPMNVIRSSIVPLGWFVQQYYTSASMPTWYQSKCSEWSDMSDPATNNAREQLKQLTCPCTEQLAMGDVSRYLPTTRCSLLSASCSEAMPKQNCYVSRVNAGTDLEAAPAAVCCYDESSSQLLYQELNDGSNPKLHGSTSYRSHPDGISTSSALKAGQAAHMSHWYWDTMRHMYCCSYSNTGTCPFYYMRQRPTPKCSTFKLGRSSFSVGDPHITSFNSKTFLFNNYGEYWLITNNEFKVQGRFEAPMRDGKPLNYTLLTATAFSVGGGASFEVKFSDSKPMVRRRQGDSSPQNVPLVQGVVYRDGDVMMLLKSESNLIAQLSNGTDSVGIDLIGSGTYANLHLSLSDSMKDKTSGLYGRWTDNAANEFTAADGTVVPFNADAQLWDTNFCSKNQLTADTQSLFNYDKSRGLGFKEINVDSRATYTPQFDHSSLTPNPRESECNPSENCKFDLRVTGDITLALATKSADATFAAMQVSDNTTLPYCDKPDVVGVSISQADTMKEGSSLTLSCVSPLTISRSGVQITCQKQADDSYNWNPTPDVQCSLAGTGPGDAGQANVGLIIGIVAGVILVIVILVVVVILVMRSRKEPSGGPGEQYMEEATTPMRPSPSHRQPPPPSTGSGRPDGNFNRGVANPVQQPPGQYTDPRHSYQQSQQQPMEPEEMNFTDYAQVPKHQPRQSPSPSLQQQQQQQQLQQQQQQLQQQQRYQPTSHSEVV